MRDTLNITEKAIDNPAASKKTTHLPFIYDYDDYKGENDFRNFFITKTFATGTGQYNRPKYKERCYNLIFRVCLKM